MNTRPSDLPAAVRTFLAQHGAEQVPLAVAYSGGLDSTVLLHILLQLRGAERVRALHVDHGLQPDSSVWAEHCRNDCAASGVACEVLQANIESPAGESLEAVARDARYQLLRSALHEGEQLVTAHHRQDQLETVLIALLRGAGVHGLAAMPPKAERDGMTLLRPLLDTDRHELQDYADAHGLSWTEDPSNADERFDRNFLRLNVLPVLGRRWPAAARAAARSSRHAAAAMAALDELADADLGQALNGAVLDASVMTGLSETRQRNVFRRVCRRLELPLPSEAQLADTLAAFGSPREDAEPLAAWPGARVRRYRDCWCFYAEDSDPGAAPAGVELSWQADSGDPDAGNVALGWPRGELGLCESGGPGLRAGSSDMRIRYRQGGEALRPSAKGRTRDFKKLLQESGVFPWMRDQIPLIYIGDKLAAVGDLWLNFDHPEVTEKGGLKVRWTGHEPLAPPS